MGKVFQGIVSIDRFFSIRLIILKLILNLLSVNSACCVRL